MKVGYHWLQDYITIPWEAEDLADRLTAIGTAVDGIEPAFRQFTGVVVARIERVEEHPQRPGLHILTITDGGRSYTVVAGAPNCRPGLVVPYAPPKTVLPDLDVPLEVRSFDGVDSDGMCCSERDLGLSEDHMGLMQLDPEQVTVGADVWDSLLLDEMVLSFELTPNRADCLSVLGIAREIGALAGTRLRRPEVLVKEDATQCADELTVEIEDPDGCPRYAGRLIRGGKVGASPFWLKRRLHTAGMRAINNAVDITNFVMLETGQPLHAFDYSTFPTKKVVVRKARTGEEFVTLDDQMRSLPAEAVMITDGKRNVAIGGVMGGQDSEVSDHTTDFLLESAYFDPTRIRRTRTRLGLATESALRFEKGIDPCGTIDAVDRAADLFAQLTGGKILSGVVDIHPKPTEPVSLELEPERTNRLLGVDLPSPKQIEYLTRLEFNVSPGKSLSVTVPTFRPDVTRPVDLIEEIARLHGYEDIPFCKTAAGELPVARNQRDTDMRTLREIVEGLGFTEIVCNTLTDPKRAILNDDKTVALRNPLSAELSIMRPDLYGSLLSVIAHNRNRRVESVAVYEIGKSYTTGNGDHPFTERLDLVLALCGEIPNVGWYSVQRSYDFYDLRGVVEGLFETLRLELAIVPDEARPFATSESFAIRAKDKTIGRMGHIDPTIADRFDVKDPVWTALVDFAYLGKAIERVPQYAALSRHPAVYRDLAVVVDDGTAAGDLQDCIMLNAGNLVENVRIFDLYSGKPIPKGKVSIAFALTYRHSDRTLTDDEVDQLHQRIVNSLEKSYGATLRA